MPGRIVVLLSGAGSNMEALADACEQDEVPARVLGVIGDRPCRGIERARRRGIGAFVVDFKGFTDRGEWNRALLERVRAFKPDLVVSSGFMRLLSPAFVDAFPERLVNQHPSLLPAYPGAHAVRDALAARAEKTGATIHFVDHGVDTGPILLQEAVAIEPGDTEAALHQRIKEVERRLLPEACRLLLERRWRGSA